jgi:hypothetical protein
MSAPSPEAMFSNEAAITITDPADDSEILFGGIRDYNVTAAYEHAELYTIDSAFRDTVKRFEHNVNVEITYAYFTLEFAQEWLGGEGATATASQDDNDPMFFNIENVHESEDGTFQRTTDVTNIVFPELPLDQISYGEYEEYSLTGSGRKIGNLEDTSGA